MQISDPVEVPPIKVLIKLLLLGIYVKSLMVSKDFVKLMGAT